MMNPVLSTYIANVYGLTDIQLHLASRTLQDSTYIWLHDTTLWWIWHWIRSKSHSSRQCTACSLFGMTVF